ncbi:MAG TPA: benzoyl-CoA-dihydrodiol lyase [Gammaproteobacteria bacterium]|nr:benzoyl-CoA-dihydrodiol lyase [Gammaproteobacteria bacterium]
MPMQINFQTDPESYRHWQLEIDGDVATLRLDVSEDGGLFDGYQLKLNTYDLGVDIELYDATQRLRFEHPAVRAVVIRSNLDRVFCAGANIRMLAGASHHLKVNFCKFTNETRNGIEDASTHSGQRYLCAVNGACAGGGYELALATDYIMLADDGASSVALPEVPLLAVLPGTGGLTRITDKRRVRRDLADVFCTLEEGVKGQRALDWQLVDEIVSASDFDSAVEKSAQKLAATSDRPSDGKGIVLEPLKRRSTPDHLAYCAVDLTISRDIGVATLTISGPQSPPPTDLAELINSGSAFWPLRTARELDDAILYLRFNEPEIGVLKFASHGDLSRVLSYDQFLEQHSDHWLCREIRLYWKRVLKRLDVTSRSMVSVIEPGSCFAGTLAEILFACDRSYMLSGMPEGTNIPPASILLASVNFGAYPMSNGLTRLETRFLGQPELLKEAEIRIDAPLLGDECESMGLVTFAFDEIDWDDEIRIFLEERVAFSPDALIGMEANLRFAGPETMETKIFSRLSAWQNWIFQRPNAVGQKGALKRYGSGQKGEFNRERV